LAFGRTDRMCREFAGYENLHSQVKGKQIQLKGPLPDAGKVSYLFDKNHIIECVFPGASITSKSVAILRIHSSDQSTAGAAVMIEINGNVFKMQIPAGYGFQAANPSHLAQAKTVELKIPANVLKARNNILRIKPMGKGWFTWDALDLRIM